MNSIALNIVQHYSFGTREKKSQISLLFFYLHICPILYNILSYYYYCYYFNFIFLIFEYYTNILIKKYSTQN